MLQRLHLEVFEFRYSGVVPAFLQPLVDGANRGDDLGPIILDLVTALGFSSFTHGISLSFNPTAESQSFVYTTLHRDWVALYDQRAYLEVDHRIQYGLDSPLPFIWDQASVRGRSPRMDQFLDAARDFGIASGVSISLRDSHGRGGFTAFSSEAGILNPERRQEIAEAIGNIMALGQYFHELFISNVLRRRLSPAMEGVPLSPRERQCLQLVANGQTSHEIATKLGITERTANHHMGNIISKLDVLNRKEAVAKAIARGLINYER
jgi:DNA-binding CsgD family transcriptional regulator